MKGELYDKCAVVEGSMTQAEFDALLENGWEWDPEPPYFSSNLAFIRRPKSYWFGYPSDIQEALT